MANDAAFTREFTARSRRCAFAFALGWRVTGVICFSSFCCCFLLTRGSRADSCLLLVVFAPRDVTVVDRASLAPRKGCHDGGGKVSRVLCVCVMWREVCGMTIWAWREEDKEECALSREDYVREGHITRIVLSMADR